MSKTNSLPENFFSCIFWSEGSSDIYSIGHRAHTVFVGVHVPARRHSHRKHKHHHRNDDKDVDRPGKICIRNYPFV